MRAIETLRSEHRLIEHVLSALETGAWLLSLDPTFTAEFFLAAADFLSDFADGCHHEKEEKILYKTMLDSGMPAQISPVAVMLHEHELGRTFTQGLRSEARRLQAGDLAARSEVVYYAKHYVNLLRNHIGIEDQIVFPIANELMLQEQQELVWMRFEQAEKAPGAYKKAKCKAMVDILEQEIESQLIK